MRDNQGSRSLTHGRLGSLFAVTALAGLVFGGMPNGVTVSAQNGKDKKGRAEQSKPVQQEEGALPESWNPEKERAARAGAFGVDRVSKEPNDMVPAIEKQKYTSVRTKSGVLTAETPMVSEGAELSMEREREERRRGRKGKSSKGARAPKAVTKVPNVAPKAIASTPLVSEQEEPSVVGLASGPKAAGLIRSFNAADTVTNTVTNTGSLFIPPDPDGAAGPNHVVNVINCTIEWYTKAGVRQNQQSLRNFFTPTTLPPGYIAPADATFDPKVIYDTQASRFVVVTISGAASAASRVYLAVSQTSDPNGGWFYYMFASNVLISNGTTNINTWFDFPGLAVDSQAVYLTGNMFAVTGSPFPVPGGTTSFGGVRLWIIPKTPFYSGGTPTNAIFDPITSAVGDTPAVATTAMPAMIYGTPSGNVGTYLVQYSGLSDGTNEFLAAIQVENPLGTPVFTNRFIPLGDIENSSIATADMPQRGGFSGISSNDRRISNHPIWRNNNLYAAATTLPVTGPDANQVTARWWRVDTTNNFSAGAPSLADTGTVGGEDIAPNAQTTFPVVAVNSAGDMAIGFSVFAPSIFASSGYTARTASDPAGFTQPASLLRAGTDFYYRRFGGTRNRWGDYTGIAVDPADDSFWVYNQHASSRGTATSGGLQDGRFTTAFGNFNAAITTAVLNQGTVSATESNANVSNNNGAIEAGEIAALNFPIRNTGTVTATGVTATLTTATTGVTVVSNSNRSYGDIAAGSTATPSVPFGFQLAPTFPCGGLIDFTMTVTYAGGVTASQTFNFQVGTGPAPTTISSSFTRTLGTPGAVPTGGISVTTGSQTGRLNRFTPASGCGLGEANPALLSATGARVFDAYTFTNPSSQPACVSFAFTNSSASTLFCAVFTPTFVPADPFQNWAGDPGTSTQTTLPTVNFSVTIPARTNFVFVVHEVNTGGGTGQSYTVNITGLPTVTCAGGAPFAQAVVNSNVNLAVTGQSVNAPTCGAQGYSNDLQLNATLTNTGTTTLQNLAFQVTELQETGGVPPAVPFRLITADGATCTTGGLVGSIQTISTPTTLLPGQSVNVTFTIALPSIRRLRFLFNVLGVNTGVGQRQSVEKSAAAPFGFDVMPNAFDNSLAVTNVTPSGNVSGTANPSDRAGKKR